MANKSGYYKYLRHKKLEESEKLATIALIIAIAAGCGSITCLLLLFL